MKQLAFDIRCEWGEQGVRQLAGVCDVLIIVDILSFSTDVSFACEQGKVVIPVSGINKVKAAMQQHVSSNWLIERHSKQAGRLSEQLKTHQLPQPESSSETCKKQFIFPSENGAALVLLAQSPCVLIGSFRNAKAIAAKAMVLGTTIGVIPAGERWENGDLRPCWEDLVGAGAIINELDGQRSPESAVAEMAYLSVSGEIYQRMSESVTGRAVAAEQGSEVLMFACQENIDHCAAKFHLGKITPA